MANASSVTPQKNPPPSDSGRTPYSSAKSDITRSLRFARRSLAGAWRSLLFRKHCKEALQHLQNRKQVAKFGAVAESLCAALGRGQCQDLRFDGFLFWRCHKVGVDNHCQ